MGEPTPVAATKAELRQAMRRMRRSISDVPGRSERIWSAVRALDEVAAARCILAFTSIVGEPDTSSFLEWAQASGKLVRVPEDTVEPTWPDVVIVPGLAFTRRGERLGQGGGWYDRMLAGIRPECRTIGVGFAEQLLDDLPLEAHDVRLDVIVTDDAVVVVDPSARSEGGT